MEKILFTQEHLDKLKALATQALFENKSIHTTIGTPLNIVEVLHTTTIGTLNNIRIKLDEAIAKLQVGDEWLGTNQEKLEDFKFKRELVNLVIGYKRYQLQQEEIERKRIDLTNKLNALKELQKTPDDRIKEIEARLAELN